MCHNEHRICAHLPCFVIALCHSAKIFTERHLPGLCGFGIVHQSFVTGDCFTSGQWLDGPWVMKNVRNLVYGLCMICVRSVWV
jgi:hypothetical protein